MPQAVQSIDYNQAPDTLRRDIAVLRHRTWPDRCPVPGQTIPAAHDAALQVRSFFSSTDGRLVSYAGAVRKTVQHGGQTFDIAGLSGVATDPDYRGRGFGSRTVAAATRWIEGLEDVDFGIFTCHPLLASFYLRAGGWPVASDVILIGSREMGALSSEALDVVVLMRLFSANARACSSILHHTTIDLGLPVGQFL